MITGSKPQRIEPAGHNKVWGSTRIEPWFDARSLPVSGAGSLGEVWFPAGDLLIKFLFTSANLSVQVHPGDEYARVHENSRGKTEMWHILRADKGAKIAVGFKRPMKPERLIHAAKTGKILKFLNCIEVQPGQTYFIPAGTVHAIGAGLVLCEIQQNSDVTYRLYDFGRDRPLHLEKAKDVSFLGCHPGTSVPVPVSDGVELLIDCPYFKTWRAVVNQPRALAGQFLVITHGQGRLNGLPVSAGQVYRSTGLDWFVEPEIPRTSGPMKILLTDCVG